MTLETTVISDYTQGFASDASMGAIVVTEPSVRQFRHRAEVPMLVLAGFLTATSTAIVIALLLRGIHVPEWALMVLFSGFLPIMAAAVFIRIAFWKTISNGIEITPTQLPDIYEMYAALALRMGFAADKGMKQLPRLYLVNGMGAMNAYTTKCRVSRAYIVIYSDLLDIAFEHGDMKSIEFVLAHELGHIKCRHVNLWRLIFVPVMSTLQLAPSWTRAQEYTADRVASFYVPDGALALMTMLAGKRMYRHVNNDSYIDSLQKLPRNFWLSLANFTSGHAVGFRRMHALARVGTEGWNVHGRML